jgi:predicted transcriptional regulator
MFMIGDYKLDKEHIMRIVNCSATSYTTETEKMRSNLSKQRDFDILTMNDEGMSLREIAEKVGCDHKTVSNVIGGEKERTVEIPHFGYQEVEVEAKRPMAKIPQEGGENERSVEIPHPEEEDTTSVFTHCTSVEPVVNPWGPKKEVEPAKVANTPKHGQKEVMTNLELSKLVDSLSAVQREFLKSCLA